MTSRHPRRPGPLWLSALVALSSACLAVAQPAQVATRFLSQVEAMASAKDRESRLAAITRRLDDLGIRYERLPFQVEGRTGVNLLAEISGPIGSAPAASERWSTILLGAHHDKVELGQGAIDDASGVAAVLELVAALKAQPLKNHRVQAAFFDQEENGLLGSRSFVASPPGGRLPDLYLNVDIFGYGDTLWVMSKDKDRASAKAIVQAGAEARFPVEVTAEYPPGDDRSFVRAQVETLGIGLVEGDEARAVMRLLSGQQVEPPPRIVTIIHSAADTPDKIEQDDVTPAISVVERAIRLFDEAARK